MDTNEKQVCVLGLGYIGLPTASMFATHGFKALGVDTNPEVLQTLKKGEIHIEEPGLATVVKAAIASHNLIFSDRPAPSDVFIIAVPTPYIRGKGEIPHADLSYVKNALKSILPHLKKGNIVILESTSPPGTTRDVLIPMIAETGLVPGKDIGVAYCPERVIPGQALKELTGNARLIGAVNEKWGKEIKKLYKSFVSGDIYINTPTVAEMVKILENTYRDVNIALANELTQICEKLGINAWDVISLANRYPRVNVHKPGPGVGGHCISVDPWFLVEKFPKETKIIHEARKINDLMPQFVVAQVAQLLKNKSNLKMTILGLAYKGNVDDDRESPSYVVIRELKNKFSGLTLGVYEPHVQAKKYPSQSLKDAFSGSDIALVLTPHDEYRALDPREIGPLMRNKVIFDTHNWLKPERWIPAGFQFYTMGSGFSGELKKITAP